jgi:hypothetical protein
MSEHASDGAGRDYDIPIVWHKPAEFDMAGHTDTQQGNPPKSPPPERTKAKKKSKPIKRPRKR